MQIAKQAKIKSFFITIIFYYKKHFKSSDNIKLVEKSFIKINDLQNYSFSGKLNLSLLNDKTFLLKEKEK